MNLAGEHEQNLWKIRICGQNLDKEELRSTKQTSQETSLPVMTQVGTRRQEKKLAVMGGHCFGYARLTTKDTKCTEEVIFVVKAFVHLLVG